MKWYLVEIIWIYRIVSFFYIDSFRRRNNQLIPLTSPIKPQISIRRDSNPKLYLLDVISLLMNCLTWGLLNRKLFIDYTLLYKRNELFIIDKIASFAFSLKNIFWEKDTVLCWQR